LAFFVLFAACSNSNSTTSPTQPTGNNPTVSLISPQNNESGVAIDSSILLQFSESVVNVGPTTVILTYESAGNAISIPYLLAQGSTNIYIVNPTGLFIPFESYTLTITAGITSIAGAPLQQTVFNFTTGESTSNLSAQMLVPTDGASNVSINTSISVEFNESVENVQDSLEVLINNGASQPPDILIGTWEASPDNQNYTFIPSSPLQPSTLYSVVLVPGITNFSGESLAPTSFSFTTGNIESSGVTLIYPQNGQQGVPLQPSILVQFSQPVQNVDATSFELLQGSTTGTAVPASVKSDGNNQYSLIPNGTLESSSLYYVMLSSQINTVTGNIPITPATFSFTTRFIPTPSNITSGALYFHGFVPAKSTAAFQDTMVLTGNNYTDLIISNYIAGAMLAHLLDTSFPNIHYNNDYLYGSIFGQLLQENIETELYESSSSLLDPSTKQASVFGRGEGGPYQINAYYQDLVAGSYVASGHSLVNYIAIQKNIGFLLVDQPSQQNMQTPAIFNNKYYGPMLATYFQINDFLSIESLSDGSLGYATPNVESFDSCISTLANTESAPWDVFMNYAYNQGFYGALINTYITSCISSNPAAFLNTYDSYNNAAADSYNQYPYQVRFYLDELYNNVELTSSANHVAFSMAELEQVFDNIFQTLGYYVSSTKTYTYITYAQADSAILNAITSNTESTGAVLDLSDSGQRAIIFSIMKGGIVNLEQSIGSSVPGFNFIDTALTQLPPPPPPICPTNAPVYPNSEPYTATSIVIGGDANFYQCMDAQVLPWCNQGESSPYAPGKGIDSANAWTPYTCTQN